MTFVLGPVVGRVGARVTQVSVAGGQTRTVTVPPGNYLAAGIVQEGAPASSTLHVDGIEVARGRTNGAALITTSGSVTIQSANTAYDVYLAPL